MVSGYYVSPWFWHECSDCELFVVVLWWFPAKCSLWMWATGVFHKFHTCSHGFITTLIGILAEISKALNGLLPQTLHGCVFLLLMPLDHCFDAKKKKERESESTFWEAFKQQPPSPAKSQAPNSTDLQRHEQCLQIMLKDWRLSRVLAMSPKRKISHHP